VEKNGIPQILTLCRDITERRQAEKKITQFSDITRKNFSVLIPILQKVALGDFSQKIEIPEKENEFTELLVTLNLMIDNLKKLTASLQKSAADSVSSAEKVSEHSKDAEMARLAAQNVLEDLQVEKERLAVIIAKNEAILASMADGCIVVDEQGKIILINKAAQNMLGYTSEESIGKQWHEILHREDEAGNPISPEKGAIRAALSAVIVVDTVTTDTSFYYVNKNGTKFPVLRAVSPIFFNGKIIGAVNVFRDITQEKEVDRAKTEFVSLASHQLRTPLSIISWYTEMLLEGGNGQMSEKQKEYLEEIYATNRRMIDLVTALLSVSRIELGTFAIRPKLIDVAQIADIELKELAPAIKKRKIEIAKKYDKTLEAMADPDIMMIVFQNLLSNAIKYNNEGGRIDLEIIKKESDILIKVANTGPAIPKASQPRIFEKLYRADNAREMDPEGTGLGLYIIKSMLERAGGKIWFESEENRGTAFYVIIPSGGMIAKEGLAPFKKFKSI